MYRSLFDVGLSRLSRRNGAVCNEKELSYMDFGKLINISSDPTKWRPITDTEYLPQLRLTMGADVAQLFLDASYHSLPFEGNIKCVYLFLKLEHIE